MTNEYLKDVFDKEYDRLISGGNKHWLAQMGALDRMYNAAYSERLKEDGAVVFSRSLEVGDRVVTTKKGCCNVGFEDGTVATIIEIEPDGGYDLESYAHNYRQSGCPKCISRA